MLFSSHLMDIERGLREGHGRHGKPKLEEAALEMALLNMWMCSMPHGAV